MGHRNKQSGKSNCLVLRLCHRSVRVRQAARRGLAEEEMLQGGDEVRSGGDEQHEGGDGLGDPSALTSVRNPSALRLACP